MKKLLKYIWALPALLLASCSEELLTENEPVDEGVLVTINLPANNLSRVALDGPSGNLTWNGGERMCVYKVDAKGDAVLSSESNANGIVVGAPKGNQAVFLLSNIPTNANEKVWICPLSNDPEASKTGYRENLKSKTFTQIGNDNTSHLTAFGTEASYIHIGGKFTAGEVRSGNITLQPLCCLATFEIEGYPNDLGTPTALTWIVNSKQPEQKFERKMTLVDIQPGKITAYMLFYPDEVQLAAGGEMRVLLKGTNGAKYVSATSEAGKTYKAGGRYTVKISLDGNNGSLNNWTDFKEDVVAKTSEFIVKAGAQPKFAGEFAAGTNWKIAPLEEGKSGYFSVSYQENGIATAITAIPDNMFNGACGNFTEIYFPDGLQSIGSYAFSGCGQLTKIVFPKNSLKTIETYAFSGCESLPELDLPENVTIGAEAFSDYKGAILHLPKGTKIVDEQAFGMGRKTEILYVIIDDGCQILNYTFLNCGYAKSLKVEKNATVTLGDWSFADFGGDLLFYAKTTSSIHSGFMGSKKGGGPSRFKNLYLNVEWLNPGDDPNKGTEHLNAGVTKDTRTPKQVTDTEGKVTYQWMDYTWKSITFVHPDGTEITQQEIIDNKYPALKETGAVWGDPNAVVQ